MKRTRKTISLLVMLSIASTTAFANKATDQLDIYTLHLKMALAAHDDENIINYATAAMNYVTTGGISEEKNPVFPNTSSQNVKLAPIMPKDKRFRKTAANPAETLSIYDAIDTLAIATEVSVNSYHAPLNAFGHHISSTLAPYDTSDKHQFLVKRRYQATLENIEYSSLKAIVDASGRAEIYELSAYTGKILVDQADPLVNFPGGAEAFKRDHPWVKFYFVNDPEIKARLQPLASTLKIQDNLELAMFEGDSKYDQIITKLELKSRYNALERDASYEAAISLLNIMTNKQNPDELAFSALTKLLHDRTVEKLADDHIQTIESEEFTSLRELVEFYENIRQERANRKAVIEIVADMRENFAEEDISDINESLKIEDLAAKIIRLAVTTPIHHYSKWASLRRYSYNGSIYNVIGPVAQRDDRFVKRFNFKGNNVYSLFNDLASESEALRHTIYFANSKGINIPDMGQDYRLKDLAIFLLNLALNDPNNDVVSAAIHNLNDRSYGYNDKLGNVALQAALNENQNFRAAFGSDANLVVQNIEKKKREDEEAAAARAAPKPPSPVLSAQQGPDDFRFAAAGSRAVDAAPDVNGAAAAAPGGGDQSGAEVADQAM